MEVTKSNFKDILPVVKKAVQESTFCAIDTELTGLKSMNTEHAFDTMDERYLKLREISKNFLVIQFGLCCFTYHEDTKKYIHKDFNFYIFPRKHCSQAPDPRFLCQASSLNYLASHGFDFNKLFYEGISYLTPEQEQKMQQSLSTYHEEKIAAFSQEIEDKKKEKPKEAKEVHVPKEHKDFINEMHKLVDTFMTKEDEGQLHLPPCTGYRRKLIYETVPLKHPTGISMNTTQNDKKQSYIVITKATDEAKLNQMQEKQTFDLAALDDAVGFRKVLEMISESKKLVVGHNMLLDLLHTINQFYYPLPPSLQEFKDMMRTIFPYIMDTKTLASGPSLKDFLHSTALFNLWDDIRSKSFPLPVVEPAEDFPCYDSDSDKAHEAGYDAFITGMCFISLSAKYANDHRLDYIPPESKILRSYINRPYIMRHYDVNSLNLRGPDPEPSRDHVFYVTFPKEWKTIDLVELFLPYGEIYVSWLNDVSALVALKTPSQAVNVRRTLLKQSGSVYKLRSYADYKEHNEFRTPYCVDLRVRSSSNSPQDPHAKRKRSGSGDGPPLSASIVPIPEEEESDSMKADKQENCGLSICLKLSSPGT